MGAARIKKVCLYLAKTKTRSTTFRYFRMHSVAFNSIFNWKSIYITIISVSFLIIYYLLFLLFIFFLTFDLVFFARYDINTWYLIAIFSISTSFCCFLEDTLRRMARCRISLRVGHYSNKILFEEFYSKFYCWGFKRLVLVVSQTRYMNIYPLYILHILPLWYVVL